MSTGESWYARDLICYKGVLGQNVREASAVAAPLRDAPVRGYGTEYIDFLFLLCTFFLSCLTA